MADVVRKQIATCRLRVMHWQVKTTKNFTNDKMKCKQAIKKVPFLFLELGMHKLR